MNDPGADGSTAPRGFDWRAIAIGAGTSLAVGFALSFLMRYLPLRGGASQSVLMVASALSGLANDALGGAMAGLLARRRGAAHGALACLLASVAGTAVTLVRLLGMGGNVPLGGWLITLPFWIALGVGVGAVAGALAVQVANASLPRE